MKGTVKWFNDQKGFGFITPDTAPKDIFVHYSGIQGAQDRHKTLKEGQRVSFIVEKVERGVQAAQVEVLPNES